MMVIERVFEVVASLCPVPASELRPTMSLYADLGLSSLEIASFVVCLEKEFGIALRQQPISATTTIAEIAGLIEAAGRGAVP